MFRTKIYFKHLKIDIILLFSKSDRLTKTYCLSLCVSKKNKKKLSLFSKTKMNEYCCIKSFYYTLLNINKPIEETLRLPI